MAKSSKKKKKKKEDTQPLSGGFQLIAQNKKARFDYHLEKKIEVGMILMGSEVKSCRQGNVQLSESYASIERKKLYLYNAHIAEYKQGGPFYNHPTLRKRELLLHKRELLQLREQSEKKGFTLVPTKIYFKRGLVKLEIALARGKTKGDKRQSLKAKEAKRELESSLKRNR